MTVVTLLDDTLRRATLSVPPDQQVVVVNQHHYAYWAALLDSTLAGRRFAIQPDNRGTAPALLLALQAVASLAGNVPVVILPSDHHVSDDRLFMAHVESAAHLTAIQPDSPVLLGIEATSAETEYGWIEPARLACTRHASIHPVRRFWEKPERATAQVLLERGCFWNSMVMVGTTSGFCRLIQSALPDLTAVMEPLRVLPPDHTRLERVYADLPVLGFSERVLMARPEQCWSPRSSASAGPTSAIRRGSSTS